MDAFSAKGASASFHSALDAVLAAHVTDLQALREEADRFRNEASRLRERVLARSSSDADVENEDELAPVDARSCSLGSIDDNSSRRKSISSIVSQLEMLKEASTVFSSLDEDDKRRKQKALEQGSSKRSLVASPPISEKDTSSATLRGVVKSIYFEAAFAFVIVTNSLFMGVQIDDEMSSQGGESPLAFDIVRYFYTGLFTIELVLRVCADGLCKFFFLEVSFWNILDSVVVFTSWMEVVMESTSTDTAGDVGSYSAGGVNVSSMRMMRVLRIARLVRVLRIGRMFRFVRAFRVLVSSILSTLKTVLWAMLMLLLIIYLFGMIFCQAIAEHIQDREVVSADLLLYWGSLPKAMFTLFKSISGGLSWHACVTPLGELPESSGVWVIAFVIYVAITTLAVLNVITGVFCESAIESAQSDRDLVVQKHLGQKKEYIRRVKQLFQDIDSEQSNFITLHEFETHFQDEETAAFFASLDLEAEMAWEIFKLLDADEAYERKDNRCQSFRRASLFQGSVG
eukprot:TRINITY_DN14448_c0_g1_i2.p1 TRINITY_DN14448_c0_g1~~TRINITY_DN14448_c0_g1_i2.p1  ORF type:complete len:525 (+),score=105.08 TRINITY_DN14448_c0_g1_i2:38-1576(+)